MTIATQVVNDAIRVNAAGLPKGELAAGYSTGSGIVPWDTATWAAHPRAVRIDQDPAASDPTADILDVESGAATFADCPGWSKRAEADYRAAKRPGQRSPAIYASLSNIPAVADALIAGGVASGVGLWIANWNLSQVAAEALVAFAGGPFPVIGVQFRNAGAYDVSVFSTPWLNAVSGKPAPQPPPAGWVYSAPPTLSGVASRAVTLRWAPASAVGHPAPASYTVALYAAGKLVKQVTVTGLTAVVTGLAPGSYDAHVWGNGGPAAPPHASFTFTA